MAPDEDCREAQRLLKIYLAALEANALVDRSAETSAREARLSKERLTEARGRYWKHVQMHGCRKL